MLLTYDTHVHTYYSPCGRRVDAEGHSLAAPERYYERAAELGLQAIIFTDHFVKDPSAPGMVNFYKGSGPAILEDLCTEVVRFESSDGCKVYIGCETETLSPEWIGVGPEMASQLDFVLVPTTHYHLPGVPQPASFEPQDVAAHLLMMLESVVGRPWVDSVAHPFSESERVIGDLRRIYEAMDKAWLTDVLGLAAENGVALEVNDGSITSPNSPNYAGVYREIVRQAKQLGCRFTFGSDAHDYRRLGMSETTEAWIASAGLATDDFLSPAALRAKRG